MAKSDEVCAPHATPNRSYCGRRGQKTAGWKHVTCDDCKAAYRADNEGKNR